MKRISTLFLLATLGLAAGAVQAAQPDTGLTGCAAKRSAIENQLKLARDQGNAGQVSGLEEALRGVDNCTDASLRKEREQKVLEARHEVAQREKDLKRAEKKGDSSWPNRARSCRKQWKTWTAKASGNRGQ